MLFGEAPQSSNPAEELDCFPLHFVRERNDNHLPVWTPTLSAWMNIRYFS